MAIILVFATPLSQWKHLSTSLFTSLCTSWFTQFTMLQFTMLQSTTNISIKGSSNLIILHSTSNPTVQ